MSLWLGAAIRIRTGGMMRSFGKVGTILGKHQINIADFSLGRRVGNGKPGAPRDAIAVVHVDGRVSEAVLAKLRGIPAVQQAKAVQLF